MSVNEIFEFVAASLILLGSIISVISAIGIIRFRDVYSRAHAATKTTTVAILTTLIGVFLFVWNHDGVISVRLMLGIVFVFITAPVSGHLVLRASYRANVKMTDETVEDELKVAYEKRLQEEAKKESD
ncbi:MAG TPA: Na+/H+ antiporter subunit G [Candidatus Pseudogracilibacillus intestinigallinarum]|uniref:Na+/H+ antiporter subunit G n=1 Tax=Candidatus Pseudogracilibacillus intestinigallinarum TaxID=2838742 RepID=A0A9D1PMU6_9BACI|nr:Na+/H+ antiporter subunit G [Candidatus Pseudogracilibacillus intestinigallinarum]